MSYQYKTTPFPHQDDEFKSHWMDRARGLLWEMGTGKSKEIIDQASALIEQGAIDAIVIVAPDGVHLNWITDEIPTHMPDALRAKCRTFAYHTDKASTKRHQAECTALLGHSGPIVLAMSYDAVCTEPLMEKDPVTGKRKQIWMGGKKFLWEVLRSRKVMYVADEARRIKTPTALRTKVVVKSSVYAPYRRLLNGTPVSNGPFDLYTQLQFLDENFWKPHGIQTFSAFKNMFGVFQKAAVRGPGGVLREFNQLLGYKNLDLLQRIVGTICSRVTKDDVLNLPPKLYSRRTFEMTPAQWRLYDQLQDEFIATLETGEVVSAPLAITRLLRFQQITSGFVPVETADGEPIRDIGAENPRLDTVADFCDDVPHGCILWCRFNRTVDGILARLKSMKREVVRYDGQVTSDARAKAKEAFQKGDAQFFVAKESTAGEGLTLTKARTVGYIESTFNLATRLQSEDRAHRIGQEHPVNYMDFVARQTVDEHIIKCLQEKLDIANQITGDQVKDWLLSAAA